MAMVSELAIPLMVFAPQADRPFLRRGVLFLTIASKKIRPDAAAELKYSPPKSRRVSVLVSFLAPQT